MTRKVRHQHVDTRFIWVHALMQVVFRAFVPLGSVQFKMCLCSGKSPYVLHPVSQGRSSSTSSFHTSLLYAISGVMSLALCLQVVSQAPQHFRSSEKRATCEGCFARQFICSVISLYPLMLPEFESIVVKLRFQIGERYMFII